MNTAAARPLTAEQAAQGRKKSLRKRLFAWHSWAGFQLALLTFIVMLSGTLAVVSNEIDWLLDSERHVQPLQGEPQWQAMLSSAKTLYPDALVAGLQLGELDVMAAEALILTEDKQRIRVFIDPSTGEVLGTGHWLNVQRILRDFHRYLFIVLKGLGLPIVTIAAVVLAVQLYTGLATTRKWLRGLITLPRRKNARIFIGDLHRFSALWTTWFTLLMVITSFWYLAEWILHSAGGRAAAPILAVSAPENGIAPELNSLEAHIAATKDAFPELRISSISLPTPYSEQVIMIGPSTDWLLRPRASRVTLDAQTAEVLAVQRPEDLTALQYTADLADPWHFGDVGGLATKLLWFCCGVILTGLSATGVWLTWRRTRQSFGRWHIATSVIMLVSGVFGFGYISFQL